MDTVTKYRLIEVNPAAFGPLPEGKRQKPTIAKRLARDGEDGRQVELVSFYVEKDRDLALSMARACANAKNQFGIEELVNGKYKPAKSMIIMQKVEYAGRDIVACHESVPVLPDSA